jgi:hypothetical protein
LIIEHAGMPHCGFDKLGGPNSPLMRVGTTITASTNISNSSDTNALRARFEALRSSMPVNGNNTIKLIAI